MVFRLFGVWLLFLLGVGESSGNCGYTPSAQFLSNSRIDYVSISSDVSLEVQLFNEEKLNGENVKTPLLFIHGYMDSRYSFLSTIECSEIEDRLIIVPSLRGFGDSQIYPAGNDSTFTNEQFVDDLIAILDHYGIESAVWIGHSLGAFISLYAAANDNGFESYVESLILIGAGNRGSDEVCAQYIIPILNEATCPDRSFVQEFQDYDGLSSSFSKHLANQVIRESYKVDIEAYIEAGLTLCESVLDSFLASIYQDVTIIWGSNDVLFPLNIQNDLISLLTNANVDFHEFTGIGHNTQWEVPAAVADLIKASI